MRELLSRSAFSGIPDQEARSMGAWTVLRTDQVFRINDHHAVERLLRLTYEVDALLSMADATRKHGFVMPSIEDGPLAVHGEGIVHPLVPDAVPNPLELDQTHRLLFLTGPNMAGKTTYLRACGIAIYLAHVGMGVPARAFRFVPAQRLFSSINLTDHPQGGVSFFRAEALRIKAIAQALADGSRVVALMDEPFKGTNVKDALDASRAILVRLAAREGSLFVFTSHLIELSEAMRAIGQVDCRRFEAGEHEGKLRFDYVLQPGVSSQRLGMHVLREEGILELLDGNHASENRPPAT
jgi:DNA mismatch repair ATPase MutS